MQSNLDLKFDSKPTSGLEHITPVLYSTVGLLHALHNIALFRTTLTHSALGSLVRHYLRVVACEILESNFEQFDYSRAYDRVARAV